MAKRKSKTAADSPLRPRGRSYLQRPINRRELRQRFLIVCEGESTEPNYFRAVRVNTDVIEVRVHGEGMNTDSLVEEAVRLSQKSNYQQVWCVFDRDSFPVQDFNRALALAAQHGFQVAYSNEAFELWYVLHFQYLDTGLARADYCARLEKLLAHSYEKNSPTLHDELLTRQPAALRNAKQLLAQYQPARPAEDNPSTTVHLLVEQLNRFVL